jgi:hypothetical protein
MNAREVITPLMRPFHPATSDFVSGRDSPREFLERCIADFDAWEPKIGAFVAANLVAAREAADRSTERWRAGNPLSPIDGIPIGVKDIMETIDMPTEYGSPLFVGFRSERDSAGVAALREAGAVILGKTVTTEFGLTEPLGTRNPWDLTRTPGDPAAVRPRLSQWVQSASVLAPKYSARYCDRPVSAAVSASSRLSARSTAAEAMTPFPRVRTARSRQVCRMHGK